jgi:transposase-like protein
VFQRRTAPALKHNLWRAVDHEGEVLEVVVTAKRDKAAAVKLLKRIMRKYGRPRKIVTDGRRAYSAARATSVLVRSPARIHGDTPAFAE